MNNKFEIQDILVAVDEILNNEKTSTKKKFNNRKDEALLLSDEIKFKKYNSLNSKLKKIKMTFLRKQKKLY